MEYMRSSVRLRAYGQRDPLIEYKNEAIGLFRQLEASIKLQFSHLLSHINAPLASTPQQHELKLSRDNSGAALPAAPGVKVGRNDPCPCGSGKKYKRCHGA